MQATVVDSKAAGGAKSNGPNYSKDSGVSGCQSDEEVEHEIYSPNWDESNYPTRDVITYSHNNLFQSEGQVTPKFSDLLSESHSVGTPLHDDFSPSAINMDNNITIKTTPSPLSPSSHGLLRTNLQEIREEPNDGPPLSSNEEEEYWSNLDSSPIVPMEHETSNVLLTDAASNNNNNNNSSNNNNNDDNTGDEETSSNTSGQLVVDTSAQPTDSESSEDCAPHETSVVIIDDVSSNLTLPETPPQSGRQDLQPEQPPSSYTKLRAIFDRSEPTLTDKHGKYLQSLSITIYIILCRYIWHAHIF